LTQETVSTTFISASAVTIIATNDASTGRAEIQTTVGDCLRLVADTIEAQKWENALMHLVPLKEFAIRQPHVDTWFHHTLLYHELRALTALDRPLLAATALARANVPSFQDLVRGSQIEHPNAFWICATGSELVFTCGWGGQECHRWLKRCYALRMIEGKVQEALEVVKNAILLLTLTQSTALLRHWNLVRSALNAGQPRMYMFEADGDSDSDSDNDNDGAYFDPNAANVFHPSLDPSNPANQPSISFLSSVPECEFSQNMSNGQRILQAIRTARSSSVEPITLLDSNEASLAALETMQDAGDIGFSVGFELTSPARLSTIGSLDNLRICLLQVQFIAIFFCAAPTLGS
jgi:hypothetical protein